MTVKGKQDEPIGDGFDRFNEFLRTYRSRPWYRQAWGWLRWKVRSWR